MYTLTALQRAYGCRCNSAVFFLNSHCLRCDTPLGYEPELGQVFSLSAADEPGTWLLAGPYVPEGHTKIYRRCANLETAAACNWLVPVKDSSHVLHCMPPEPDSSKPLTPAKIVRFGGVSRPRSAA